LYHGSTFTPQVFIYRGANLKQRAADGLKQQTQPRRDFVGAAPPFGLINRVFLVSCFAPKTRLPTNPIFV